MPGGKPKNVELQEVAKRRQSYQDYEVCTKPELIFCFRLRRIFGLNGAGLLECLFDVCLLFDLLDIAWLNLFGFGALLVRHSYRFLTVSWNCFCEMAYVWPSCELGTRHAITCQNRLRWRPIDQVRCQHPER